MTARPLTALAAATLLLAGAAAATAHATAPGRNGDIAFRRYLGPDRTNGAIFTVAPNGKHERRVATAPDGYSDDFPDFASDGSLLAFQRCKDFCHVVTARPDGSHLRDVTVGCADGQAPPDCTDNWYPAVAPDVRRIAYVRASGAIVDDVIDHVRIWAARIDGSHAHPVTDPPSRVAEDNEPQWSPDGRRIVFTRSWNDGSKQAIFTVKADGSDLRQVTPFALAAGDGPDWSPDGSRILFRSPENDDFLNSNLFTIRPDGTGLKQITHVPPTTKIYSSSFSPDGRSITFGMMGLGGLPDVYKMKADGSDIKPVQATPDYDSAPDWGGRP